MEDKSATAGVVNGDVELCLPAIASTVDKTRVDKLAAAGVLRYGDEW